MYFHSARYSSFQNSKQASASVSHMPFATILHRLSSLCMLATLRMQGNMSESTVKASWLMGGSTVQCGSTDVAAIGKLGSAELCSATVRHCKARHRAVGDEI